MILLKIAFRNLREHKIKTLIIGSLIALGIAFMIVGNSIMDTITNGLKSTYRENFTSDIIIRNYSEDNVNFIGGFGGTTPAVSDYLDVVEYLDTHPAVKDFTPLLSGSGTLSKDDLPAGQAILWAIQVEDYRTMFEGKYTITEGTDLIEGEEGIVLSEQTVRNALNRTELELKVGDIVKISGQNNTTGTKIREVPIVGIGSFANTGGRTGSISFIDTTTLRALSGLTALDGETSVVSEENPDFSDDALFGGSDLFASDSLVTSSTDSSDSEASTGIDFDNILGDTSVRDKYLTLDNNAWNFILVQLENGRSLGSVKRSLASSDVLSENIIVEDWRWGAGFQATIAYGIRNILNIIIFAVAIVAIIIIMNTLVISVTERIAEIGTVRAIGGQRGFVRSMIMLEVLMICLVFGVLGIILGAIIVLILGATGFSPPPGNFVLRILFGGGLFKPVLSVPSLFYSLIIVVCVGVVASLYPIAVALGIAPVQAMEKGK